ncbi:MAG TPA: ABC transporter ATP-binding protein [Dongiaceae bacterium]|jgi:ABC-type multidrug transport system fused ATPase/permease subunit|nr:ABC transporter ATP-binding protein [Dongiaceae bacterium]
MPILSWIPTVAARKRPTLHKPMPRSIFGFVWRMTRWDQVWIGLLSIAVFVLSTAPLELQRRLVNDAIGSKDLHAILLLGAGYAGIAFAEGGLKLLLNIYCAWVGENAVRRLRQFISRHFATLPPRGSEEDGLELSILLAEVEPIGGFLGDAIAQPMLQGGILLSVFGYMFYLNPFMAMLSLAIFSPQLIFVPLMQTAINRRAGSRIRALRQVSIAIVAHAAEDGPARQGPLDRKIERVFTLNMGIFRIKFTMNFLMNLAHHLGIAVVLAVGGLYTVKGALELGTVVAFVSGLDKINDPWGDIVNWYRDFSVIDVKYRLISDVVENTALPSVPQAAVAE